jgi:hypothetical protein
MCIIRKTFIHGGNNHVISIQTSGNTDDNYLFLVYQISDTLGVDVKDIVKDFDDSEKSITLTNSQDGTVEIILITEIGLYKLLDIVSRQQTSNITYTFKRWLFKTLSELRINDNDDDEDPTEDFTIQEEPSIITAATAIKPTNNNDKKHKKEYKYGKLQHDDKLKQYANKDVFYTSKLNQMGKQYLIKIGRTHDLATLTPQNIIDFGGEILLLDVFQCSDLTEFERRLQEQTMLQAFYQKTNTLDGTITPKTFMLTSSQYKMMIQMFHDIIKTIDINNDTANKQTTATTCEIERLKIENNKLLIEQRKYELQTKQVELKILELNLHKNTPTFIPQPSVYSALDDDEDYGDNVSALGQESVFSVANNIHAKHHELPTKTQNHRYGQHNGGINKQRRLNSDLIRR